MSSIKTIYFVDNMDNVKCAPELFQDSGAGNILRHVDHWLPALIPTTSRILFKSNEIPKRMTNWQVQLVWKLQFVGVQRR